MPDGGFFANFPALAMCIGNLAAMLDMFGHDWALEPDSRELGSRLQERDGRPMESAQHLPREPSRRCERLACTTSLSLVQRLGGRDDGAWRDFMDLYMPLVVCWCKRKGVARADIADLAQDVCREVTRSIAGFRGDHQNCSFRGWLSRIVHRQIAHYYERGRAQAAAGGSANFRQLQELEAAAEMDEGAPQVQAETIYLYHRAVSVIRGEFNDKTWEVFWRLAVDERPAAEVAAEHQLTPAAARQIKSRVLRRLKQAVGDVPD